ncbi:DASH family cryptochrome [Alteromonas sp. 345S023]|uniref:Cryptochrome DASH n=1 Tax=Alteromonas profundi TaxID=2696062 RepID=A0A7X5LL00_9ALTE|nr:DASH family cryptochrome [Alteromonas profundi]NDV91258.1 DASH family cryptochrome [Alteromonas profundi]
MNASTIELDAKKAKTKGLFWFRHDLRLHDQRALNALCDKVDAITMVYVLDETWLTPNQLGLVPLGKHRLQFLHECLNDLRTSLHERGHELIILKGDPVKQISTLLTEEHYSYLGVTHHGGFNEIKQLTELKGLHPSLTFVRDESCSLFDEAELPFSLDDMPDVFSPFRRIVEKALTPRAPCATHFVLPAALVPTVDKVMTYDIPPSVSATQGEGDFTGGETAALSHLHRYLFEWQSAATYKETRNALDNWRDSTKLSPWLALGAISPKEVMRQVTLFEATHVKNDSTYWIYFELLWREFFFWLQQKYGRQWFQFTGIQGKAPNTAHNSETFKKWCDGETGYPIVDACMRQLAAAGYMSNRGRQLVASCLVHELGQDWRYGAAWFEHQLIDYDVASNWGNWLYLAGVGSDPRGHRQFNLAKQTQTYDPDGEFCRRWLS